MPSERATGPGFAEALGVWLRIGLLSFGGPAAQIALIHREIVEQRGWLGERPFLNGLNFCMLLPGPEAMQLATYAGWRLHGVAGGLAAGLSFVLPGAAVVLALAMIYAEWGDLRLVAALFLGVGAAVAVVIVQALVRISRRALAGAASWAVALASFVAIFFLDLPYPLIVLAAAAFGWLRGDRSGEVHEPPPAARPGAVRRLAGTVTIWLLIWFAPFALLHAFGAQPILTDIGAFFSRLAVVTFGGAYAVLAYMAQDVVVAFGWLTPEETLHGLGLAETTPGPLILVTEFVGFLAAWREGGLWLGVAGAAVTLWVTFAPCFLWIFAGAPFIDWISDQPRLRGALSAITAAVVGVILNLALWFFLHIAFADVEAVEHGALRLWTPDLASVDWRVIALAALSAALLFGARLGMLAVLGISALLGLALVLI
ncbi:chromate efflux transporter [Minwuia thermotolerans]|uniref:Chromate transporter n=1 Tax=Minwuia thermotolerans TaxID=2056226 RepID=A0A2M9FWL5_9PROT|nr:chromate efflux transporter [Minwuia thermotolerans]PJK27843.1 chromate transporter [Minwuia thermotolerans]